MCLAQLSPAPTTARTQMHLMHWHTTPLPTFLHTQHTGELYTTNSMQRVPSETKICMANQEILRVSCKHNVHYCSKGSTTVPHYTVDVTFSPPHHAFTSILIVSSRTHLRHQNGLSPSDFPTNSLWARLFSAMRATCPISCITTNQPFDLLQQCHSFPNSC